MSGGFPVEIDRSLAPSILSTCIAPMLEKHLYQGRPISVQSSKWPGFRNFRCVIVLAAIAATCLVPTLLIQAQKNDLQKKAAQVKQQLKADSVEGLVSAIQATGQNQSTLPWAMLPEVQSSLLDAVQTARERNRFAPQNQVYVTRFSPNAQTIATAGAGGRVSLWDTQGTLKQMLDSDAEVIRSIDFSPDGTAVVGNPGDAAGTIQFWKLQEKSSYQPPPNPSRFFTATAFSSEGQLIVNGSNGGNVRLWNPQGESIGQLYPPHQGAVTAVGLDGGSIVSAGEDGRIHLWNDKGDILGQLWAGASVRSLRLSQAGQRIISEDRNRQQAFLWDAQASQWHQFLLGETPNVQSADLSPNNRIIARGYQDGGVQLLSLAPQSYRFASPLLLGHKGAVNAVTFSPNGKTVLSGGEDGTVRLWDVWDGTLITRFHLQEWSQTQLESIALSPDGNRIAFSSDNGKIRIRNLQQQPLVQLPDTFNHPVKLSFSSDGQTLAVQPVNHSSNGLISLWRLDGQQIARFSLPDQQKIQRFALSPQGNRIISLSSTGLLQLWNETGKALGHPLKVTQPIQFLQFSPDGQQLIGGGIGTNPAVGQVCLWKLQGDRLEQQACQASASQIASFSPNGKMVVIGATDGQLQFWNWRSNQIEYRLPSNQGRITSLIFSPDGQTLASGDATGTIRLWDRQGHALGQPFVGHQSGIQSLAFNNQGETIVSLSQDGEVRLWQASWQGWLQTACDRLQYHPVFTHPTTHEQHAAKATCHSYLRPTVQPSSAVTEPVASPIPIAQEVRLVVKLGERKAYVYRGDSIQASYPVAIGQSGWETPVGQFKVFRMLQNPGWTHPLTGATMPAGTDNPLGERWMSFWTDGHNEIGFHGTPARDSIGTAASHGCLRMYNEDARALYEQVKLGTPVTVEP